MCLILFTSNDSDVFSFMALPNINMLAEEAAYLTPTERPALSQNKNKNKFNLHLVLVPCTAIHNDFGCYVNCDVRWYNSS